jgi:D-alanine-D-alanine ligase
MTSAPAFVPVLHGAAADRPDEADTVIAAETIRDALGRLGYRSEIVHLGLDLGALSALAARRPALVFNLVEALAGDGTLAHLAPSALEHFGLAYSGGTAQSLRDTLSKTAAKRLLQSAGLPTPAWSLDGTGLEGVERVIVKSIGEHASIGIDAGSVVAAGRAVEEIAARQVRFGGRFFAESYIGGREFNVAVFDDAEGPQLLPVAEIDFIDFADGRARIVDYAAKWEEESVAFANTRRNFDFPAADSPLLKRLGELALATWRTFDLSGYVRVDFRVDSMNKPWILEINVNPCLSPDAGFAAAAARAGMDYDEMIGCIVSTALARPRKAT